MKKIIRLTESELMNIVKSSVRKALREDVLGNNWHESDEELEDKQNNNYQAFDSQVDDDHDWGIKGEQGLDPTDYGY